MSVTRAQIAKAFKAARRHLAISWVQDGRTAYICLAIVEAREMNEISRSAADAAMKVIGNRLGHNQATVGLWLVANVPESHHILKGDWKNNTIIQAYRHRWLDALIEEFSK